MGFEPRQKENDNTFQGKKCFEIIFSQNDGAANENQVVPTQLLYNCEPLFWENLGTAVDEE